MSLVENYLLGLLELRLKFSLEDNVNALKMPRELSGIMQEKLRYTTIVIILLFIYISISPGCAYKKITYYYKHIVG